jgi:FlaG/FlaF family flagellin (archaellin)
MFKRTKLISMVAIAALLVSGIATATAPDHPKKKTTTTQASKQVAKSTSKQAKPSVARPSAARPGAVRFEPREEVE